jgi:hypothetical protein
MKNTGEGMRHNNGVNQIIEFIRENALSREMDSQPVITSKGERFLQELGEAAARLSPGTRSVA